MSPLCWLDISHLTQQQSYWTDFSVRQEGEAIPGQTHGRGMFEQSSPSWPFANTLPTSMLRNGKTISKSLFPFLYMATLTIKWVFDLYFQGPFFLWHPRSFNWFSWRSYPKSHFQRSPWSPSKSTFVNNHLSFPRTEGEPGTWDFQCYNLLTTHICYEVWTLWQSQLDVSPMWVFFFLLHFSWAVASRNKVYMI